ncbi:putative transporter protein [Suhomyces tanzawaensis NRRL Y-17324]|uniref:Putative transporter protein n=1 Tax=Suhomyces tanzawaensis NRRL Y-17324 TaxID=984487 RepID=A0A1E4SDU8_9ASCO|nr:putative transporter protein [Suhomyces tanzawaensis NRRL Y-17324]ODV77691.1 putative transporter protein [Suhomyces tanzawaensis NRRL Y-17324]
MDKPHPPEQAHSSHTVLDVSTAEDPGAYSRFRAVRSFLIAQWFFIGLAIFVVIARFAPLFAKQGGLIRAEYTIGYGAVAIIFFISGLTMGSRDLLKNFSNWRAHITVLSLSFLITSAIMFGIVSGIRAAHDGAIDDWVLVGIIITHACPTTVSSNVVMTKQAHGNDILTLCEVFVGNILGAFVTPALIQMYMRGVWEFGNPSHQDTDVPILDLYRSTMKQLGCSVFVPLFVGQVIQNIWPKQTKWVSSKFYLNKVGSFMLLLIMFQSFSTAFAQHAFTAVSHVSIIFLVFFNIGMYLFFTAISYCYARPWPIKYFLSTVPDENSTKLYTYTYKIFRPFYYNRRDAVAVMLCGPAKTAALGVSLVSSQYGAHNPRLGILLVPLVLYQSEQVITAQVLVNFMRKWVHAEDAVAKDHESALGRGTEPPR